MRLALSKLPFRNGRIIITKSGIISRAPATYPKAIPIFTPKTLNSQTARTSPIPISCGRPTSTTSGREVAVAETGSPIGSPGNQAALDESAR